MRLDVVDGVGTITLDEGSGNAMGRGFFSAFSALLDQASGLPLVITGNGGSFSVGLDLRQVLTLSRDEAAVLIEGFSALMQRLFLWPRPTVALLNGNAVAGGFILAACCDFRVASGPGKFGMTGVTLGISYPPIVTRVLTYVLPKRMWHEVLLAGRLFTAEEAIAAGLVDEIGDASSLLRRLSSADARAYERTKLSLKGEAVSGGFVDSVFDEATRARVQAAVERLRSR